MTEAELLTQQWRDTRDWTLKLIADLDGDDWMFQPGPGLAHPLWLCGHFSVSQHLLIHVRCLDSGVLDDDFVAHFPIGGPIPSGDEHDYPTVAATLDKMHDVHERTMTVIAAMSTELLNQPAFGANGSVHPHYQDKRGVVLHGNRHEAFHAGQLALIRRLLSKRFLR